MVDDCKGMDVCIFVVKVQMWAKMLKLPLAHIPRLLLLLFNWEGKWDPTNRFGNQRALECVKSTPVLTFVLVVLIVLLYL